MIEIVFFFNPAVLWISKLIREERENCCDDLALSCAGSKQEYIKALLYCQEFQAGTSPYAMAITGRKNQLLERVSRIVFDKSSSLNKMEKTLLTLALVFTLLFSAAFTKVNKSAHQGRGAFAAINEEYLQDTVKRNVKKIGNKNSVVVKKKKINQKNKTIQSTEEKRSIVEEKKFADEDKIAAREDAKAAMEDSRAKIEDSKAAMEDSKVAMEDSKVAIEDAKAAREDAKNALKEAKSAAEESGARTGNANYEKENAKYAAATESYAKAAAKYSQAAEKYSRAANRVKGNYMIRIPTPPTPLAHPSIPPSPPSPRTNPSIPPVPPANLAIPPVPPVPPVEKDKTITSSKVKKSVRITTVGKIAAPDRTEEINMEMAKDGLINPKDNLSFRLDQYNMTVNGIKQSDKIHQKYKTKYLKTSGTSLAYEYQTSTKK